MLTNSATPGQVKIEINDTESLRVPHSQHPIITQNELFWFDEEDQNKTNLFEWINLIRIKRTLFLVFSGLLVTLKPGLVRV
jgi:hypothetical protein